MPETVAPESLSPEQASEGMILHEPISFASTDGTSTCVGDLWSPPGKIRGVVQIAHGMVEHLGRYEEFALELCRAGYAVCGVDHIGHGRSCSNPDLRGVYDPETGADALIEDQHSLRKLVYHRFAGKPYFVLGHSMGSIITRCYIARHGGGLSGAILLSDTWQPYPSISVGKALAKAIGLARGWEHRSSVLESMGVGSYNKEFEAQEGSSAYEWLSRDTERVRAFAQDPDCGWSFSVSGYYTLFELLGESQNYERLAAIPPVLPVLVMSGSEDPVGSKGADPARIFRAFKEVGVQDVELIIQEGARHELLNDLNREEAVNKLISWLREHTA